MTGETVLNPLAISNMDAELDLYLLTNKHILNIFKLRRLAYQNQTKNGSWDGFSFKQPNIFSAQGEGASLLIRHIRNLIKKNIL